MVWRFAMGSVGIFDKGRVKARDKGGGGLRVDGYSGHSTSMVKAPEEADSMAVV